MTVKDDLDVIMHAYGCFGAYSSDDAAVWSAKQGIFTGEDALFYARDLIVDRES